jgi:glycosyltransferase involved in cell wall biosynthesis
MDLSALKGEPNVYLLGRKPYDQLPAYCKGFDAALIPFPISPVTVNSNPLKAREYLAAGLPVVSTAIPEVEVLQECLIGRTPEEFVMRIHQALANPGSGKARSLTMQNESWETRLNEIRRQFMTISGAAHPTSPSKLPRETEDAGSTGLGCVPMFSRK